MSDTVGALAEFLSSQKMACECAGNADLPIRGVATLEEAGPDEISFLSNPKYEKTLSTTRAGAVVVATGQAAPDGMTVLRVADPYAAITMLIIRIHGFRKHPGHGVHPDAQVHDTAQVGENATIMHDATVGERVSIGKNVVLYPGAYVAAGSRLGDDCVLHPNVVIYDGCVLGNRVTIHANSVIGEDGLGYAPLGRKWHKIPQVGIVEIGDDVEIGACCTIDRATLGRTMIGAGTKFSNMIAIGHGSRIGRDCMFVAQVGIAGSVTVGEHVTMAGKVGVAGHLTIGDDVQIAALSGVMNDIPANTRAFGQPALPMNEAMRVYAVMTRLPEMREKLRRLEREVEKLHAEIASISGPADRK